MSEEGTFSTPIGLVYIYNVIVANGVLALPGGFGKGGYVAGMVFIFLLAFLSYVTALHILEAIAVANALCGSRSIHQVMADNAAGLYPGAPQAPVVQQPPQEPETPPLPPQQGPAEPPKTAKPKKGEKTEGAAPEDPQQSEQTEPVPSPQPEPEGYTKYDIIRKYELCELAMVLLKAKWKRVLVYLTQIIYLVGDLAVNESVIGTTLTHVTCTYRPVGYNCTGVLSDSLQCWANHSIARKDMYRVYIILFIFVVGPFAFFELPSTKILQVMTYTLRTVALVVMIIWNIQKLSTEGSQRPVAFDVSQMPKLFGICVYAFMWHFSEPCLVHPIEPKSQLIPMLAVDYVIVTAIYLLLPLTAVFAFENPHSLYTLNFWSDVCGKRSVAVTVLEYFLAIYPVFSISTTQPILVITFADNVKYLVLRSSEKYHWCLTHVVFTISGLILPTMLALISNDLSVLIGWVGAITGMGVQYIIPVLLVVAARQWVTVLPPGRPLQRPFKANWWQPLLYVWVAVAFVLILTDLIMSAV